MDKNNKNKSFIVPVIIIIFVIAFIAIFIDGINSKNGGDNKLLKQIENTFNYPKTFKIISSQENKSSEVIIQDYAKQKGYDVEFEYAGTLDIIQKLNQGEEYDAVWLSNSMWGYMLDSNIKLSNSKCTSINPVIFGIKKSKAQELGLIDKTVYTQDIVDAISSGKLKFSMSNPTSTNSGASAYLGMLSTFAGNPEVLTKENLDNEEVRNKLKTFFTGQERTSGSEDFLEELFLKSDSEAVVAYESSIININKQLQSRNKETLYAIYPVDGVSISDSPFAYIDKKDTYKKDVFTDIQKYLLSDEGQKLLQEKGKRTWYGGITNNADKSIFNPEWGIDTTSYISPIKYPNTEVIKLALNVYQTELRKPVHVVFCLDYSGSMSGEGEKELKSAMEYILTEKAANDFIQFSDKDKIDVLPFNRDVGEPWSTTNGTETETMLKQIKDYMPTGSTAIYPAASKALELLKDEDQNTYNVSIILMTDGLGNVGTYRELEQQYRKVNKKIPIYSIMFGDANKRQLDEIADLTNATVFDGKLDLVKAFKEVRGYN